MTINNGQYRHSVNVVGPAVQKNYRRTIGWAGFSVANTQEAGINLLERPNEVSVPSLIVVAPGPFVLLNCACAESIMTSLAAAMFIAAEPKNGGDHI